jgi:molybdopterin-guanine dinucleotide biosynthesis adapter protein
MRTTDRSEQSRILGVAGWKNSGKTSLVAALVADLTQRRWRVSTVKHAHHDLAPDGEETDSARHARAGALEVAVVSPMRWCIGQKVFVEPEPQLGDILKRLSPCDLVLAEGYKSAPIEKIEVRRAAQDTREPLAPHDPKVIAIAADHAVDAGDIPVFRLDDIVTIADFIVRRFGPPRASERPAQ